jgi:galactose mutarotase-like enzyme
MVHYIENDKLIVGVKEFGCELTSIKSKESGYEYLWQGNPDIWSGQSPILFPIVGRLIDDKYYLDGKEYTMPKHGFARKMPWDFIGKTENSMSFILRDTEDTRKIYPYAFEVTVTYTIDGNNLSVSHDIKNCNNSVMYFSLGAHPAFNCAIGDVLSFDENETLHTEKIDLVQSLRLPEKLLVLDNKKDIIITEDIFNEDALILSDIKSENLTLNISEGNKKIKFNLGGAPYLGIWAKPGAPYVCIEPWCGVNDDQIKRDDFSEKDGIHSVESNETFNYTWKADFTE